MAPSGGEAFDPADVVGRALVDAAVAAHDAQLIEAGLRVYRRVSRPVDEVVRAAGAVLAAFPSQVLRPGPRRECLVVVVPDSILVAWPGGALQADEGALVVEKSRLVRVEIALAHPAFPFPLVATVEGAFGLCSVGLPRGATVFGVRMREAVETGLA
ncbi:hypothetical protein [Nocardioides sp.]|uniref:hypothetical protein n=1 Tax=Nocardioides sp. TaxID=35761 RepID=UPI002633BB25|nr:hypothetical protein [Nocardioides sp.]MDI6910284.1 hypothetical protein [Nocardioides sp.]